MPNEFNYDAALSLQSIERAEKIEKTGLEKNHASMRKFTNILDQWKNHHYNQNYQHPTTL